MKKRWISLLLVFVMMLSLLPFGVLADEIIPNPGYNPGNNAHVR